MDGGARGGCLGAGILADHDGGVLAAAVDGFGYADGEVDIGGFVGGEGAGGVFYGGPVGDFGIDVRSGEVGGVFFADNAIRGDADDVGKIARGVGRGGDGDGAAIDFAWLKREALAHWEYGK